MATTGLSGDEIFCLNQKGVTAGDLVVGNSVFSLGFVGGIGSGIKTFLGGEVHQMTEMVREGRLNSYQRLVAEAQRHNASGITGVTNELIRHAGNIEYLSIGSAVHASGELGNSFFSTSADGRELFCQLDAGFHPVKFVFGNVAYSIGFSGGIVAGFRSMKRGEVKEYSDALNMTRHLALSRIKEEAAHAGANAVVGIKTTIQPVVGVQEMVMIGTASHNPHLPSQFKENPVSSSLSNVEMWNLCHLGYSPIELVLGVSVYSLGVVGGIMASLKNFVRGEISELTTLIYEARHNAIEQIAKAAANCGADDVVGVTTYVNDMGGGLIEFMAMGTAVKKIPGMATASQSLPMQAGVKREDTFVRVSPFFGMSQLNNPSQYAGLSSYIP